jgi:hypothetical protein
MARTLPEELVTSMRTAADLSTKIHRKCLFYLYQREQRSPSNFNLAARGVLGENDSYGDLVVGSKGRSGLIEYVGKDERTDGPESYKGSFLEVLCRVGELFGSITLIAVMTELLDGRGSVAWQGVSFGFSGGGIRVLSVPLIEPGEEMRTDPPRVNMRNSQTELFLSYPAPKKEKTANIDILTPHGRVGSDYGFGCLASENPVNLGVKMGSWNDDLREYPAHATVVWASVCSWRQVVGS